MAVAGRSRRSAARRSVGRRDVSAEKEGSDERLGRVNQRGGDGATAGTRDRAAAATGRRSRLRCGRWPFDEVRLRLWRVGDARLMSWRPRPPMWMRDARRAAWLAGPPGRPSGRCGAPGRCAPAARARVVRRQACGDGVQVRPPACAWATRWGRRRLDLRAVVRLAARAVDAEATVVVRRGLVLLPLDLTAAGSSRRPRLRRNSSSSAS